MEVPLSVLPIPPRARPPPAGLHRPRKRPSRAASLYAAAVRYPLTLAQLRQTLIGSPADTASEIIATIRDECSPGARSSSRGDGYFFPAGRQTWSIRACAAKLRSRAFLLAHRTTPSPHCGVAVCEAGGVIGQRRPPESRNGWRPRPLPRHPRAPRVEHRGGGRSVVRSFFAAAATLCANFMVAGLGPRVRQQDLFTASQ